MADFFGADWYDGDWDTGKIGAFSSAFGLDYDGGVGEGYSSGFSLGFDRQLAPLESTTLGAQAIGATTLAAEAQNALAVPITVTTAGLATGIEVAGTGAASFGLAGYLLKDNAGAPGDIICPISRDSFGLTISSTARWLLMPMLVWLEPGDYWIANENWTGVGGANMHYDTGVTGDGYVIDSGSNFVLSEPGTTGVTSTVSDRQYSIRLIMINTLLDQEAGAVLFQKAPTFFQGSITVDEEGDQTLSGILFQKSPSFFQGTVTTTYTLSGTLFQKAGTFFVGSIAQVYTLSGVLFSKSTTFFTGTLSHRLLGVLFQKAPTFFAGELESQGTIAGVLFTKAPTFFQGSITTTYTLSGVLFSRASTFFTGTLGISQTLSGILFAKAGTFFVGSLNSVQTLSGILFSKAPTFFQASTVSATLQGILFQKAPNFFSQSAVIEHGRELASDNQDFTGDTAWHTVLTAPASNFVAGGTYLLLVTLANVNNSSGATSAGVRVAHGTTPTQFDSSERFHEAMSTTVTEGFQYSWFAVFTQPGTTEDLIVQVMTESSAQTVSTRGGRVIQWIRLDEDLTQDEDWFYNENNTDAALAAGTAFTTRASISLDPPAAGDDWLILARERVDWNSAGASQLTVRLVSDPSGSPTLLSRELWNPKDPTDRHTCMVAWLVSDHGDAAITYGIQEAAPSTTPRHKQSAVFAINLNKFAESTFAYDVDPIAGSTSYVEITPDGWTNPNVITAEDWFVLAFCAADINAIGSGSRLRIQIDGNDEPPGWDTGAGRWLRGNGTGNEIYGMVFGMPSFATGTRDIDFDAINPTLTSSPENQERLLVAFSMRLVGGAGGGTITTSYTISGTLFSKSATFFTGEVDIQGVIAGALFAKAITFFQGSVTSTRTLTGILFQKSPTFLTGSITTRYTLSGVLFSKAGTFFIGTVSHRLLGVLFQKSPTFFVGELESQGTLAGILFQKSPTFFIGTIHRQIHGVLFSKAPTFFTGAVQRVFPGVTFIKSPTFFVGALTSAKFLVGGFVTFSPDFFTGTLSPRYTLSGVLFSKVTQFRIGTVTARAQVAGATFAKTPTFFIGEITRVALTLGGLLFSKAPAFFVGTLTPSSLLLGITFTKSPTFFVGLVRYVQTLEGVLFQAVVEFHLGQLLKEEDLAIVRTIVPLNDVTSTRLLDEVSSTRNTSILSTVKGTS